jgi:hypothetical protein
MPPVRPSMHWQSAWQTALIVNIGNYTGGRSVGAGTRLARRTNDLFTCDPCAHGLGSFNVSSRFPTLGIYIPLASIMTNRANAIRHHLVD